jgi:glyceraldehyde-3-phosphate dehydrogenase/erythrose-4-phosphate dehydrogenase
MAPPSAPPAAPPTVLPWHHHQHHQLYHYLHNHLLHHRTAINVPPSHCHRTVQEASETYLKDILGFEENQLVSTDFVNDARSSIVDKHCTQVRLKAL